MAELVPDPGFDDPLAWDGLEPGIAVTGSQLVFTNIFSAVTTLPVIDIKAGVLYQYSVDVDSFDTVCRFHISSSYTPLEHIFLEISNGVPGVRSGEFTAANDGGLYIQCGKPIGSLTLNSISISDGSDVTSNTHLGLEVNYRYGKR